MKKTCGKMGEKFISPYGRGSKKFGAVLRLALISLIFFLCVGISPLFSAEIFVVASYHEGDMCGQPQYDAAVEALKQSGISDLSFRGYYLDSRRRSSEQIDEDINRVISDIREHKPEIVIAVDDLAFARLYKEILNHPSIKLVFTGLNRAVEFYDSKASFIDERGRPNKNITGVFEYLFMKEQLEMLEVILQRPVRRVALIHSVDAIGVILKDQIADELASTQYADALTFYAAEDLESLLRISEEIGTDDSFDAWIPVTMSVRDADSGKMLTMENLVTEMTSRISKPDLALNFSFTELGFYGGVSVDFYQMGFQTGLMAAKLLKGHSISSMPIENARNSIIAINTSRLRDLDIPLPEEFTAIVDIFFD